MIRKPVGKCRGVAENSRYEESLCELCEEDRVASSGYFFDAPQYDDSDYLRICTACALQLPDLQIHVLVGMV